MGEEGGNWEEREKVKWKREKEVEMGREKRSGELE
jgi:hypothetical protein